MRYVVIAMLAAFALVGAGLAWNGLTLLVRLWWRGWELVEREGTIVSLDRQSGGLAMRSSRGRGRRRHAHTASYPVIRFDTPDGEPIEFRSAIGELGPPFRYAPGQRVKVLYDPAGALPPRLLTATSRYAEPALLIVAGLVFLGAAALIAAVYGDRLGLR